MEVRDEIVARAEQLFMRIGVKSVTMDDISRELGISKKTLYQHFENKDNLIEAVISTHLNNERQVMEGICSKATDALDEIRTIGVFITAMIEDVSPSTLFDLQKYYHKSWQLLIKKQDEHMVNCIVKNIEKGKAEGHYRADANADIIARIYAKATYSVVEEVANPNSKFSRRELIWELHNYHIHALATPAGLALWKQYNSEMKYYDTSKTN